jgi:peptide/nickel transport system substrate-binding protein
LLPSLRAQNDLTVSIQDPTGLMGCMRLNHLTAPFNNPAIRRVLLKAIDQTDFMQACAGDDPSMYHVPTGLFCPTSPMATDAGLQVFEGKRDYDAVRKEIAAAGYNGEKVVILAPTDLQILKSEADVSADIFHKIGLNVDYQAMDWGSVVQRRALKEPVQQVGWSVASTFWSGLDQFNPVAHVFLRGMGQGPGSIYGWPSSPKIEALRDQWLDAAGVPAQQAIARELQLQEAYQESCVRGHSQPGDGLGETHDHTERTD